MVFNLGEHDGDSRRLSLSCDALSEHRSAHHDPRLLVPGVPYFAAGNGTVNVVFTRTAVTIEGSLHDYRSVADSGNVMHRRFCPVCGTHLFSEAESRPHLIIVRAGTLDDPEIARPAMTIWRAQAPTWACIDAALPSTPSQPPPA